MAGDKHCGEAVMKHEAASTARFPQVASNRARDSKSALFCAGTCVYIQVETDSVHTFCPMWQTHMLCAVTCLCAVHAILFGGIPRLIVLQGCGVCRRTLLVAVCKLYEHSVKRVIVLQPFWPTGGRAVGPEAANKREIELEDSDNDHDNER